MFLSGVQNALPGFPAKPLAGRPPKTCLHAEVRRFSLLAEAAAQASTQACGNDSLSFSGVLDVGSEEILHVHCLHTWSLIINEYPEGKCPQRHGEVRKELIV